MKKILFAAFAIAMAATYSCSKDPGVSVPPNFGASPQPSVTIILEKVVYKIGDAITPTVSGNNIGSVAWDFGDQTGTVNATNPSHTYASNGNFTIKATVTTADKHRTATTSKVVFIGQRYFDSAVLYKIPTTDSSGSPWRTVSLGPPSPSFNLRAAGATSDAIPYDLTWNFPPKADISGEIYLRWKDTATVFELTPVIWTFTLRDDQSGNGSGPYKPMHAWKRDLSRDANNPIELRGSSPTNPYRMEIYWHQ